MKKVPKPTATAAGIYEGFVVIGGRKERSITTLSLPRAKAFVRRQLERHGDKVTSWMISCDDGNDIKKVAGAVEVPT